MRVLATAGSIIGRVVSAVAVGLFVAGAASASELRLPRTVERTLDNGLRVIVCPLPGRALVDVRVEIAAGGWTGGPLAGSGAAHFLEHLLAAGSTETRSAEESGERLRDIGGALSAKTDVDRSWFEIRTTSDGVATALELLADWMSNPTLPDDELDKERGVIASERALYDGHAPRRAYDQLCELIYVGLPARFPILGDEDRFLALDADDLRSFRNDYHAPSRMVVCVTGDVDGASVLATAGAAFGAIERRNPAPLPRVHVTRPERTRRAFEESDRPDDTVAIGWPTVPFGHPDGPALEVLGLWMSSRLSDPRSRVAHSVGASRVAPAGTDGMFRITAGVRSKVGPHRDARPVAALEEAVRAAVRDAARGAIPASELDVVRRAWYVRTTTGLQEVDALGHRLASDFLRARDSHFLETFARQVARVETEDLARVASRYLAEVPACISVVGPADGATAEIEPAPSADGPTDVELGRGAVARVAPREPTGVVGLCVAFRSGVYDDADIPAGAPAIVSGAIARAYGPASRDLIARGGRVSPVADAMTVGVTVEVMADDLELAVDALREKLAEARALAPEVVEREAGIARNFALRRIADARGVVTARIEEPTLGFLAWPHGPTEREEAIVPGAVEAYANETLVAANLRIGVAGDVTPARVEALCRGLAEALDEGVARPVARVGGSVVGSGGAPPQPSQSQPGSSDHVTVAWAFETPGVEQPEVRVAIDLLDAYLSGRRTPSGPLFDALRAPPVSAYVVDAWYRPAPGRGVFIALAECDADQEETALEMIWRELVALAKAPIPAEELDRARHLLLASRASVRQRALHRCRILATSLIYGLPVDSERRYRTLVRDLEPEWLKKVAASVFLGEETALHVSPTPGGDP